ncbi:GNAT family N-acetyltransferase [Paraferrimonas haliotis]|uniref:GNAT family N-acetyltransferase n=1 Tax=Paraferrimonas haliotis TaxID=2013866 RepID=UPI000BA94715|nr:GNAT family N-acetyltransferase [Paraferrimonas haliotis]
MSSVVSIRHANRDELAAIVDIYNQSIPHRMATADVEPVSVSSRQAWFDSHHERRPLWVAVKENRVLGWCSLRDFYGRPAYDITAEVAVYIDRDWHGFGVAQYLLRHAINKAPSLGIQTLVAFVFAHNLPSIGLFQKNQFQVWGELPQLARLDKRYVDLTILGLPLNEHRANI